MTLHSGDAEGTVRTLAVATGARACERHDETPPCTRGLEGAPMGILVILIPAALFLGGLARFGFF